jgi:hypothetical protein
MMGINKEGGEKAKVEKEGCEKKSEGKRITAR